MRKDEPLPYLRPDGKTQVTVETTMIRVSRDTIAMQHDPDVTLEQIRDDLIEHVVKPVVDEALLDDETRYFINPTGRFVIGGPGDSGLTGRKWILRRLCGVGLQ